MFAQTSHPFLRKFGFFTPDLERNMNTDPSSPKTYAYKWKEKRHKVSLSTMYESNTSTQKTHEKVNLILIKHKCEDRSQMTKRLTERETQGF